LAVGGYSVCSSSLLVVNKLAIGHFPFPSVLLALQFAFAALIVGAASTCCGLEVDKLEWKKVKPYLVYVVSFVLTLFCNVKALSASNVDTLIVFRSGTPLGVAVLDWVFLGRQLPGRQSLLALSLILVGTGLYVRTDAAFAMHGILAYGWILVYVFLILFDMTYGKHLMSSTPMTSTFGPVYYNNLLALPFVLAIAITNSELSAIREYELHVPALAWISISCIISVGISWAGFETRRLTSATSYTVIGVANKLLAVLLNVLIWDKHATGVGIIFLLLTICGSSLYRQAPLRDTAADVVAEPLLPVKTAAQDESEDA